MHCIATFHCPAVSPNTGILAFQNARDRVETFRVSLTGVVVELEKSTQIVKKLKLVGYPTKIFKNTAFIRDMFSSELEVAKHEGAIIRTVSGIRGIIKKALPGEKGLFRASFEDKILMSDIVFLRAWVNVEPRALYNPMCTLLEEWDGGMRTVAELRRDMNVPIPTKADSVYRPFERPERKFNPLRVPESLQAKLPFKSKPKLQKAASGPSAQHKRSQRGEVVERRTAVIHSTPAERKVYTLIQQLNTVRAEKEKTRKESAVKRAEAHQKRVKLEARKFEPIAKERRKREMRQVGLRQGAAERKKARVADDE
jgi:ribosome biogenesis protein BMS1